jgi:hypothetical protein
MEKVNKLQQIGLVGPDRRLAPILSGERIQKQSKRLFKGGGWCPGSGLCHRSPTFSYISRRGKSRRSVKTGSDNIFMIVLYGTVFHACQGADGSLWYREAGLSEQIILPDNTRAFGDGSSA